MERVLIICDDVFGGFDYACDLDGQLIKDVFGNVINGFNATYHIYVQGKSQFADDLLLEYDEVHIYGKVDPQDMIFYASNIKIRGGK